MIEIRTAELQFNLLETTDFLNRTMRLSLNPEQIAILETRTEGWVVGLQMAALLLQGPGDPKVFIQAFGGSHRFILEFLTEEVLNRQPPAVQVFLLCTSIYERFCAESCDFLLEKTNTSQTMLGILQQTNLFIVAIDDEGHWFRYHHLFAKLLRGRLKQTFDAAAIQGLYCRASQWYESHELLAEAIGQALSAPDLTYAIDLLERNILTFFYQSEITQVHHWLKLLPESLLPQHPILCAVFAVDHKLLHITGKGGRYRPVPIPEDLLCVGFAWACPN